MRQLKQCHLNIIFIAIAIMCTCFLHARAELSSEEKEKSSKEDVNWELKEKRPFCNAFAGCGKKRAQLVKEMQNIALGRALPSYAYYTNTDLKLLTKLIAEINKAPSEEVGDTKH